MRETHYSIGAPEVVVFLIAWLVSFLTATGVIYLIDSSRPLEHKIGPRRAIFPSFVLVVAFFFFRFLATQ